nr:hypothetical protein [Tanacetum cinerariifolium]
MHTRASNSKLVEPLPKPEYDETLWAADCVVAPTPGSAITILETVNEFAIKDDETLWAADCVVAPTPGSAITILETVNEFAIKGNHLTLIKGNQFDGRTKTDPYKHIHEFLGIYDMFKYRDTKNEAVRLMMFPLSLTGEAKTRLDELNEGTIKTEIHAFSQHENKSLTDAWLRMKEILQNCHGHNFSKGSIIKIFYHGLSEITQEVLNAIAGGIFLYKTPNQAYQLLDDKVLLNIDVINEILEEDFDALLDEGSKILHSIKGTILEEEIFFEFNEFMAIAADENSKSKSDTEELPFEKISINTDYKIKTSLEEPPTDLELKPLLDNLEYVFLEEPSFLP